MGPYVIFQAVKFKVSCMNGNATESVIFFAHFIVLLSGVI